MKNDRVASIEAEMDAAGVRDIYDAMVLGEGQSPNMAAMLALQQPPGSWNTDSDFNRKENNRMAGMADDEIDKVVRIAKRAGISTHGKTYNGQLGKYDDPGAWVSGTGDVKDTAIRKGLTVKGAVNVDAYAGPKKKVRIAPDILDGLEQRARSKNAKLDEKCRKSDNARTELRERLTNKHSKPKD